MIFERPIELETVVDTARRVDMREQYYRAFAQVIGADQVERAQVLEAMHVLECTHGAPDLVKPVPTIALAISTAVRVLSETLTSFAQQRNYAHAGIYLAVLIEDALAIAPEKRRAPAIGITPRAGNPALMVEDFLAGARTLVNLRGASAHDPERNAREVWQIAEIVCLARQRVGVSAAQVIATFAHDAASQCSDSQQAWPKFADEVNAFLTRCNVTPPPSWRAMSFLRRSEVMA
jgi:hypothetical protein